MWNLVLRLFSVDKLTWHRHRHVKVVTVNLLAKSPKAFDHVSSKPYSQRFSTGSKSRGREWDVFPKILRKGEQDVLKNFKGVAVLTPAFFLQIFLQIFMGGLVLNPIHLLCTYYYSTKKIIPPLQTLVWNDRVLLIDNNFGGSLNICSNLNWQ